MEKIYESTYVGNGKNQVIEVPMSIMVRTDVIIIKEIDSKSTKDSEVKRR